MKVWASNVQQSSYRSEGSTMGEFFLETFFKLHPPSLGSP